MRTTIFDTNKFVRFALSLAILLILLAAACSEQKLEQTEPPVTSTRVVEEPTPGPTSTVKAVETAAPEPTSTPEPAATPEEEVEEEPRYTEPGDYLDSLIIGGLERFFVIYLPPQFTPGEAMPVVLNLHGAGSNAFQQRDTSQMNQKADEEGFIVVYPQAQGQPPTWFGVLFEEVGQLDMDFFEALVEYLQTNLPVDLARIYLTGISNGGTMANRLGCEMSEVFAAIAPVAGAHSGLHLCEIEQPVSMVAIHGTDDQIIDYEGNGSDVPSVETWVEAWAKRDGCLGEGESSEPYENVELKNWMECDDGVAVALYKVVGGGHSWLGLEYREEGGAFYEEVGATDVIWEFFEAHPRKDSESSRSDKTGKG